MLHKTHTFSPFNVINENKADLPGSIGFTDTRHSKGFEVGILWVYYRGYRARSPSVGINIFHIHGWVHTQSGAH